jgi:hypothetical protein
MGNLGYNHATIPREDVPLVGEVLHRRIPGSILAQFAYRLRGYTA